VGRLLHDARAKAYGTRPFVACIDLNLAPNRSRTDVHGWMDHAKHSFDQLPRPTPDEPDVVSGYLLTNFAFHYQGEDEMTDLGQSFLVVPEHVTCPIPMGILHRLREACRVYGALPPREW
jgi:hypothetical protein